MAIQNSSKHSIPDPSEPSNQATPQTKKELQAWEMSSAQYNRALIEQLRLDIKTERDSNVHERSELLSMYQKERKNAELHQRSMFDARNTYITSIFVVIFATLGSILIGACAPIKLIGLSIGKETGYALVVISALMGLSQRPLVCLWQLIGSKE